MRSLGGKDKRNHLKNCLTFIFTNSLAKDCSYEGSQGNHKLKGLPIINILFGKSNLFCHIRFYVKNFKILQNLKKLQID